MASSLTSSVIDVEHIKASEYVSAVGLVILLWDHVLTFADEVELIWKARLSIPKVLFLFNRYAVPLAMIAQSHDFSSTASYLSPTSIRVVVIMFQVYHLMHRLLSCRVWSAVEVAVGMLSIATSNFLVLLRLWVVWDRCPRLVLGTLTFYVVTQILAMGFTGYVIYELLPMVVFDPALHICTTTAKPKLALLWSPGVAFESMVFMTTVWNALDRPRSRDSEMAKIMYRDGSMYFFGLFALRLVNLVISLVAPVSLVFMGVFFIWSVSNVTLTHLILNLRRLSQDRHDRDRAEAPEDNSEDSVELPLFRITTVRNRGSDPEGLQYKNAVRV